MDYLTFVNENEVQWARTLNDLIFLTLDCLI